MSDTGVVEDFLFVDVRVSPPLIRCLCCGDSYALLPADLSFSVSLLKLFRHHHLDKGCSQLEYMRRLVLEEL